LSEAERERAEAAAQALWEAGAPERERERAEAAAAAAAFRVAEEKRRRLAEEAARAVAARAAAAAEARRLEWERADALRQSGVTPCPRCPTRARMSFRDAARHLYRRHDAPLTASILPDPRGLAGDGEWVPLAEAGNKSFGWYQCTHAACPEVGRIWMSAHALAAYTQACEVCGMHAPPAFMWLNYVYRDDDGRRAGRPGRRLSEDSSTERDEDPHRSDLCGACTQLGHPCWVTPRHAGTRHGGLTASPIGRTRVAAGRR
jgi:hypothetical protein